MEVNGDVFVLYTFMEEEEYEHVCLCVVYIRRGRGVCGICVFMIGSHSWRKGSVIGVHVCFAFNCVSKMAFATEDSRLNSPILIQFYS